jgi:site-specific DNA-methyltransferase (adenine-specific)
MLAFGGTRTYHRLACAVEDAGFEIRDCLMWLYGSGFPKGKGCLKPAYEPILLCRKPGPRVRALGIEECRVNSGASPASLRRDTARRTGNLPIHHSEPAKEAEAKGKIHNRSSAAAYLAERPGEALGRWPANIVHDGSEEVVAGFPQTASGPSRSRTPDPPAAATWSLRRTGGIQIGHSDSGSAARFFYTAKASPAERGSFNDHPTVKPLALMKWLVCLVCPPGGIVLDQFCGSGSTITAAREVGREGIGMDLSHDYLTKQASRRIQTTQGLPF